MWWAYIRSHSQDGYKLFFAGQCRYSAGLQPRKWNKVIDMYLMKETSNYLFLQPSVQVVFTIV